MKRKLNKGFTLAELLIVVAVIAVLVAISIPIFNKQLEKSREAYDISTMRQAASLAVEYYYSGVITERGETSPDLGWWNGGVDGSNAFGAYDPANGKFVDDKTKIKAYGKGTNVDGGTSFMWDGIRKAYAPGEDYRNAVVMIAIYPAGANKHIDVYWKNNRINSNYVGGAVKNNDPRYSIRIPLE